MTTKKDDKNGTYDTAPEPSAAEIAKLRAENAQLKADLAAAKGETPYVPVPYPKMVNGTIVQSEDEHKAQFPDDYKESRKG